MPESLACRRSRRNHSHPNQHTQAEMKLIRDMRRRNPNLGMVELWHRLRQRGYPRRCIAGSELRLYQYTAIDEFTRLRFLAAFPEQFPYSSVDFLNKLFKCYARRGIRVERVQTDNSFEFPNRFSNCKREFFVDRFLKFPTSLSLANFPGKKGKNI